MPICQLCLRCLKSCRLRCTHCLQNRIESNTRTEAPFASGPKIKQLQRRSNRSINIIAHYCLAGALIIKANPVRSIRVSSNQSLPPARTTPYPAARITFSRPNLGFRNETVKLCPLHLLSLWSSIPTRNNRRLTLQMRHVSVRGDLHAMTRPVSRCPLHGQTKRHRPLQQLLYLQSYSTVLCCSRFNILLQHHAC